MSTGRGGGELAEGALGRAGTDVDGGDVDGGDADVGGVLAVPASARKASTGGRVRGEEQAVPRTSPATTSTHGRRTWVSIGG